MVALGMSSVWLGLKRMEANAAALGRPVSVTRSPPLPQNPVGNQQRKALFLQAGEQGVLEHGKDWSVR
jgi:hypothetical protein